MCSYIYSSHFINQTYRVSILPTSANNLYSSDNISTAKLIMRYLNTHVDIHFLHVFVLSQVFLAVLAVTLLLHFAYHCHIHTAIKTNLLCFVLTFSVCEKTTAVTCTFWHLKLVMPIISVLCSFRRPFCLKKSYSQGAFGHNFPNIPYTVKRQIMGRIPEDQQFVNYVNQPAAYQQSYHSQSHWHSHGGTKMETLQKNILAS